MILFTFNSKKVKNILKIEAISEVIVGAYKWPHAIRQAEKVCIIGRVKTERDASLAMLIVNALSYEFSPL